MLVINHRMHTSQNKLNLELHNVKTCVRESRSRRSEAKESSRSSSRTEKPKDSSNKPRAQLSAGAVAVDGENAKRDHNINHNIIRSTPD